MSEWERERETRERERGGRERGRERESTLNLCDSNCSCASICVQVASWCDNSSYSKTHTMDDLLGTSTHSCYTHVYIHVYMYIYNVPLSAVIVASLYCSLHLEFSSPILWHWAELSLTSNPLEDLPPNDTFHTTITIAIHVNDHATTKISRHRGRVCIGRS